MPHRRSLPTLAVFFCFALAVAACRHGPSRRLRSTASATDPCRLARTEVAQARRAASEGFLERGLVLLDHAEQRCSTLRLGDAELRSGWIVRGQMKGIAERWVEQLRARTDRTPEEVSQSKRALEATDAAEPRSGNFWLEAGNAAAASKDLVLARVLFTRALDSFDREGQTPTFRRLLNNGPSGPERLTFSAFSPTDGFFLEGDLYGYSSGADRLTMWGFESRHPYILDLPHNATLQDAAVSPRGVVLFRAFGMSEWNPFTNNIRYLGDIHGDAGTPAGLGFSSDARLMVWGTVLHRIGDGTLSLRSWGQPLAIALSSDGALLTIATETHVSHYTVPRVLPLEGKDGERLEPLWEYPIGDTPVSADLAWAPGDRDVALSHDGKWLLTRDDRRITLHTIDSVAGIKAVSTTTLPKLSQQSDQRWGRPGQLQLSPSDQWVLIQNNGAYQRVVPIGKLGADSCVEADPRGPGLALGFLTLAGREWLVMRWDHIWRLKGIPTHASRCGEPHPTLEVARLDRASHGRDALELVAEIPCEHELVCPPSGTRTQLQILWIKNRRQREEWMSTRYGCLVGEKPLPWPVCALRFESEDLLGSLSALATAEAVQP